MRWKKNSNLINITELFIDNFKNKSNNIQPCDQHSKHSSRRNRNRTDMFQAPSLLWTWAILQHTTFTKQHMCWARIFWPPALSVVVSHRNSVVSVIGYNFASISIMLRVEFRFYFTFCFQCTYSRLNFHFSFARISIFIIMLKVFPFLVSILMKLFYFSSSLWNV